MLKVLEKVYVNVYNKQYKFRISNIILKRHKREISKDVNRTFTKWKS